MVPALLSQLVATCMGEKISASFIIEQNLDDAVCWLRMRRRLPKR